MAKYDKSSTASTSFPVLIIIKNLDCRWRSRNDERRLMIGTRYLEDSEDGMGSTQKRQCDLCSLFRNKVATTGLSIHVQRVRIRTTARIVRMFRPPLLRLCKSQKWMNWRMWYSHQTVKSFLLALNANLVLAEGVFIEHEEKNIYKITRRG